jgi:hypothetical protein
MLNYIGILSNLQSSFQRFWIPMMIYNTLNMIAIYTFQIPWLRSAVPLQARQLFGLYHYTEMQISFNFIGLVVGWAATVLLFVLFAYRLRERTIIKSYPAPFQAKNPASYSSHLRTSLQKKERTAQKFLGKYGWKFCLLALLLVTLLVPSVLGMILLLAVFVGAVVPHERLERVKFIPALLCYFTLWLIAQYLFNLPVDYGAVSALNSDETSRCINTAISTTPRKTLVSSSLMQCGCGLACNVGSFTFSR